MSEALNYLLKVRPDAMQAYFSFIKKSSGSLDDRTKAIISVITKVDNQTEKGFKQYLKRALDIGVSANEIIDAMMVAFPTLGLTKIVWAIEIVIEMDLPEFRPENLVNETTWHKVMDIDELKPNETLYREIANRGIFVHMNKEASIIVFDQHCPHQATAITDESLNDKVLTCPKHDWKFDITNGECIEKGDQPLTRIEYKVDNNQIWVCL